MTERRRKDGSQFDPGLIVVLDRVPTPGPIAISLGLVAVFGACLAVIVFGERDRIVYFPGTLRPVGEVKTVKAAIGGRVARIFAKVGDHVQKGQLIYGLDLTEHRAERRRLVREWQVLRHTSARIETTVAALRSEPSLTILARHAERLATANSNVIASNIIAASSPNAAPSADGAAANREQRLLADELSAYEARLRALAARIENLQGQVPAIRRELQGRRKSVQALRGLRQMTAQLHRDKTASRAQLLQRDHLVGAEEAEVGRVAQRLSTTLGEIITVQRTRDETYRELIRKLSREWHDASTRAASHAQRVIQAQSREGAHWIHAPADGILTSVAVHTVGDVVHPGQQIAQVVPRDHRLHMRARLPDNRRNTIKVGQRVRVTFPELEYARYGSLGGSISYVAAAAEPHTANSVPDADNRDANSARGTAFYPVHITLDRQYLQLRGQTAALAVDTPAQAAVVVGTDPLYEIVIKPLRTLRDRALRKP